MSTSSTQGPFTVGSILTGSISGIVGALAFQNPPVWNSSDPTIYAPIAAADGLSCQGTLLKAGEAV